MKKLFISALLACFSLNLFAADYVVDYKGAHASINFKVEHLGFSWLTGRFNTFDGTFSYDQTKPEASSIVVNIDTASVDSNHAERDKHLRDEDFLDVGKYPSAKFESTSVKDLGDGKLQVTGNLTMLSQTKPITIEVNKIGEGEDPWGGYRVGFEGTTSFKPAEFGMKHGLAGSELFMELHIEGIKKQ
jgi:polyisoprenoid-binding protein YceI